MLSLPPAAQPLGMFAPAFSRPTYRRFLLLSIGAIVCMGRRTVSHVLWSVRCLANGSFSSYQRVLSFSQWSCLMLARILATAILKGLPAGKPVLIPLDDTTDGPHRGKHVYGKGCWRDPVLSSKSSFTTKWGHKWVVLAINIRLPFCSRYWALPVLSALARPRALNDQEKRRHKTPSQLGRQLVAVLIHWFPERKFILLGDWGYGSHEMARFCHRHRKHVTLVARSRGDLNLYAPPAKGDRRDRRRGLKLLSPRDASEQGQRRRSIVRWYGNSQRIVELFSDCGNWYRARGHRRAALVPIRWVFVRDSQGKRDDWLQSTDQTLMPEQIVEYFAARWSIEVTFQETREHLGLETTRNWKAKSVLRAGPCLLALYSVVTLMFSKLAERTEGCLARQMPWYRKVQPTFSDALYLVRQSLWSEILVKYGSQGHVTGPLLEIDAYLLERLSAAA